MLSRREVLAVLGAIPAASLLTRSGRAYAEAAGRFPRRLLGRTGRTIVPLALGGQASLQWTKPGIDAPDIIVRAVQLGLNYLDTANAYGPSQSNSEIEPFFSFWIRPTLIRCVDLAAQRDYFLGQGWLLPAGRVYTLYSGLERHM